MERRHSAQSALVAAALAGIVLISLDLLGFLVEYPTWAVALGALTPVVIVVMRSPTRIGIGAVVAVAALGLSIPNVRWNLVKSFYVDCRGIEIGISSDSLRTLMGRYHLQRADEAGTKGRSFLDSPHFTFHPSEDHSADWCVVFLERGEVAGVEIIPD